MANNNYRTRNLGEFIFLSTDHGSHCILNKKQYSDFIEKRPDAETKRLLEEREILISDIAQSESVRLMRNRNHFLFSGTSLHIIITTLRCNMKCVYCHASSKKINEEYYDMNEETAKKTVDFIFQSPNKNITIEFQGGEPLINWKIVKIINEYAKKKNEVYNKNLRISIVTNLSLMNEEIMEYIISQNINVCTSLDGPKDIHDFNRISSNKNNYDQVIYWIKRFQEEYLKRKINTKINALVTITKKSLNYPKEIVNEYVNLGIKSIHLRPLNKLGVAKEAWKNIGYSVEEYLKFWKDAVEYIEYLNSEKEVIHERIVTIMTAKLVNEFDPGYLELRSPCGAAIGQLAYNFNGDIYTCDEARMLNEDLFRLGNVYQDNQIQAVCSVAAKSTINASINDQYICDACAYKPYCGICPVCNYAEQGNIIAKIPLTDRCKINKFQFDWVIKEKFINIKIKK